LLSTNIAGGVEAKIKGSLRNGEEGQNGERNQGKWDFVTVQLGNYWQENN
jgi:hypothetical protein